MSQSIHSSIPSLPLISVAMCTYNGERFINEQIESILSQTYQHIELLISDDGSSDGTIAIIKEWIAKDNRIHLYQNETNLGYNKNFEKIIGKANGDIIAISDQDDLWHKEKLEKMIVAFRDPEVSLVHSAAASLKGDKISTRAAQHKNLFQGTDPKPLFFKSQISGHAMAFRITLLPAILPIPDEMYYDWWIAVTAAANGKVVALNECLVTHRLHDRNSFFSKTNVEEDELSVLLKVLNGFKKVKGLQDNNQKFLDLFIQILNEHKRKKKSFNSRLFFFLWKNRKTFFGYKKRQLPEFTYLKYCLSYAKK